MRIANRPAYSHMLGGSITTAPSSIARPGVVPRRVQSTLIAMNLSVHRARTFVPQRVVQLGWLLVAGICVSLLLAGIVPYMRLVTVACQGPDCLAAQRTAEELQAMQRAGVPVVPEDGPQLTAMALFPAAIALLTAAYCIWRRPADRSVQ